MLLSTCGTDAQRMRVSPRKPHRTLPSAHRHTPHLLLPRWGARMRTALLLLFLSRSPWLQSGTRCDGGPSGGNPGPQSLPTPRAPAWSRGGVMPAASIHLRALDGSALRRQPRWVGPGLGGRGARGWGGGCGAEGQLPGCGAASSCASEASSAQSRLLMRWQLAAHLGCVLLRCFQLDLDLGTRRVPRLDGVWVG